MSGDEMAGRIYNQLDGALDMLGSVGGFSKLSNKLQELAATMNAYASRGLWREEFALARMYVLRKIIYDRLVREGLVGDEDLEHSYFFRILADGLSEVVEKAGTLIAMYEGIDRDYDALANAMAGLTKGESTLEAFGDAAGRFYESARRYHDTLDVNGLMNIITSRYDLRFLSLNAEWSNAKEALLRKGADFSTEEKVFQWYSWNSNRDNNFVIEPRSMAELRQLQGDAGRLVKIVKGGKMEAVGETAWESWDMLRNAVKKATSLRRWMLAEKIFEEISSHEIYFFGYIVNVWGLLAGAAIMTFAADRFFHSRLFEHIIWTLAFILSFVERFLNIIASSNVSVV